MIAVSYALLSEVVVSAVFGTVHVLIIMFFVYILIFNAISWHLLTLFLVSAAFRWAVRSIFWIIEWRVVLRNTLPILTDDIIKAVNKLSIALVFPLWFYHRNILFDMYNDGYIGYDAVLVACSDEVISKKYNLKFDTNLVDDNHIVFLESDDSIWKCSKNTAISLESEILKYLR